MERNVFEGFNQHASTMWESNNQTNVDHSLTKTGY